MIQTKTVWKVLVWFANLALAAIPIVYVQIQETTKIIGGSLSTWYEAFFGWPFKAVYAIKTEHSNGKIEYDLKQFYGTEFLLDSALTLILIMGAMLFLRRLWMIRRLSFSLIPIFALTFAVAVCLLFHLRGFHFYLWALNSLKLEADADWIFFARNWSWQLRIVEAYVFAGSFAAFLELSTFFRNRSARPSSATDLRIT